MSEDDERDPFAELATESEDTEGDPFAELAADLEASRGETEFEDPDVDMEFSEEDFDALWAQLEGAEEDPGTADVDVDAGARTEVVPKRSFCEQCQYLSEPPEVHCTHEGTRIVEFVDNKHVRVKNCPIVAERRGPQNVEDP